LGLSLSLFHDSDSEDACGVKAEDTTDAPKIKQEDIAKTDENKDELAARARTMPYQCSFEAPDRVAEGRQAANRELEALEQITFDDLLRREVDSKCVNCRQDADNCKDECTESCRWCGSLSHPIWKCRKMLEHLKILPTTQGRPVKEEVDKPIKEEPEAPSGLALDKRDTMERGVAVEEERKVGDDVKIKVESPEGERC
jgi:hypothetical protein